jgi:hypothetical protein
MGGNPRSTITENYNGSSWSEVNDMATARDENLGRAGTGTTALMSGGNGNPGGTNIATTEEWSFTGIDPSTTPAAEYADAITGDFYYNSTTGQFKTVNTGGAPIGSWSSGGSLNTARNAIVSISHGSESSGLVFGGNPNTGKTEKYDGSSWAESGDLNTSRSRTSGAGTQTSAIAAGGYAPPGAQDVAEEFNGSSWTEIAEANSSRFAGYGWGANAEAVVIVAGSTASTDFPAGALTEQWNGSAWTETGDLNTARNFTAGFGTSYTSGIIAGGSTASGNDVGNAESFDGSSWTEVSDLNTTRTQIAGYGTDSDNGYIVGGYNYGPNAGSANTESWNGSSWTEVADLSTARWDLSAGGGPGSSIAAGGQPASSPNTNATEEWTAADFQIKTVTTS